MNDTSTVTAAIADGTVATHARIDRADTITIAATRTSHVHATTVGVPVSGAVAAGAAVTVVTVDGTTSARIGSATVVGAQNGPRTVGDVTVSAATVVHVGPYGSTVLMAMGIGISAIGSASAGVAIVDVLADTRSSIGHGAQIATTRDVKVDADADVDADVDADGGALGGLAAVGVMVAEAHLTGIDVTATIEPLAFIQARDMTVHAGANTVATVGVVAASGGLFASGAGARGKAWSPHPSRRRSTRARTSI